MHSRTMNSQCTCFSWFVASCYVVGTPRPKVGGPLSFETIFFSCNCNDYNLSLKGQTDEKNKFRWILSVCPFKIKDQKKKFVEKKSFISTAG